MHVLCFRTGPFTVRLHTNLAQVKALLSWAYGGVIDPSLAQNELIDLNVIVTHAPGLRRWWRPQAIFGLENDTPFDPYPATHAFPLLEWGLNWSIATRAHQYLMLHAGALARNGRGLILPAMPGAGKSTLCAAMSRAGWRFLSDEFGLVDHQTGDLHPLPRAIPLKNRSIDVIATRGLADDIGPRFENTRKGTVAHLRPPGASLNRQHAPARPTWVIFPRYIANRGLRLSRLDKSLAFTRLAQNAFNYRLLGGSGFDCLTRLILDCHCATLEYSDLDDAIEAVDELTSATPP